METHVKNHPYKFILYRLKGNLVHNLLFYFLQNVVYFMNFLSFQIIRLHELLFINTTFCAQLVPFIIVCNLNWGSTWC